MASAAGGKVKGPQPGDGNEVTFGFKESKHVVLECAGSVNIKVVASRPAGCLPAGWMAGCLLAA